MDQLELNSINGSSTNSRAISESGNSLGASTSSNNINTCRYNLRRRNPKESNSKESLASNSSLGESASKKRKINGSLKGSGGVSQGNGVFEGEDPTLVHSEIFIPTPALNKIFKHMTDQDLLKNAIFVNKKWHQSIMNCSEKWQQNLTVRLDDKCGQIAVGLDFYYYYGYLKNFGRFIKNFCITGNNRNISVGCVDAFLDNFEKLIEESASAIEIQTTSTNTNTNCLTMNGVNASRPISASSMTSTASNKTNKSATSTTSSKRKELPAKPVQPYAPFNNANLFSKVEKFMFSAIRLDDKGRNRNAHSSRWGNTQKNQTYPLGKLSENASTVKHKRCTNILKTILSKFLTKNLQVLQMPDLYMEPEAGNEVFSIIAERFSSSLEILDVEDMVCWTTPQETRVSAVIEINSDSDSDNFNTTTTTSQSQGGSQGLAGWQPAGQAARRHAVQESESPLLKFKKNIFEIPNSLSKILYNCKSLKKIHLNYNYLSKSLLNLILECEPPTASQTDSANRPNNFGQNLKDFHIRVDKAESRYNRAHNNTNQLEILNQRYGITQPTISQFNKLSKNFPKIRFSFSFEKELSFAVHKKILRDNEFPEDTFRLHRLEFRGDKDLDLAHGVTNVSETLLKVVPAYSWCLKKLIVSVTSSDEFLDHAILTCVRKLKNLEVLRIESYLSWETVKEIMNLIRFSNDNLTEQQMSVFDDYPDCVPQDDNGIFCFDSLPKKLKRLSIKREHDSNDDGVNQPGPLEGHNHHHHHDHFGTKRHVMNWLSYTDERYLRNEYRLGIERLERFEYLRYNNDDR